MIDREHVILGWGTDRYAAVVPENAALHRVPTGVTGNATAIRGVTFERTERLDDEFGLPLFRRKSRQL